MSSAFVIASLAAALLAQAGAAQINQIGGQDGGATGSAATVPPLEILAPTSDATAGRASAPTQITPAGSNSTSAVQLGPPGRDTGATDQLGRHDRSTGAAQLTSQRRTASAPSALSSVREGHVVSTVVVHGHDRCSPAPGQPMPAECAHIIDQRPDDFAPTPPTEFTPDELIVVGSPPASRSAGAVAGLTGPDGGDAALSAALAGVLTQTLPSSTSTAPSLGTSVNATLNAAAGSAYPTTSTLPGGIVVTVTPTPK